MNFKIRNTGVLLYTSLSMMVFLLIGCTEYQEQSGFRVRSDFVTPLNADSGWAGAPNENVTVYTDQPFRIRFETVGTDTMSNHRFTLQYRRNEGPWTKVEAAKFPKPDNSSILDFDDAALGTLAESWRVVQGYSTAMEITSNGTDKFLRATANQEPLLGLAPFDPPWKPEKLTIEIRLQEENQAGAGIIIGYEDPKNYYLVYFVASGALRVSRFVDGVEKHFTEKPTRIIKGQWLKSEIQFKNGVIEIEFEDGLLEFDLDFKIDIAPLPVGFYVPALNTAEFGVFELEGSTSSPRVSIVNTDVYQNGEATTDLLALSNRPFLPGSGMNFSEKTVPWPAGKVQSEWEWPLVIRRFADGAVTNEEGDIFEFRMVDSNNRPFKSNNNPTLTLSVPRHHIGGTFVETPGRIGPFQASNGDLYFIIEPAETDNRLMMIKSIDNGVSWREVDGANRPKENDLEGLAAEISGNTIHIIHQQTNHTWHHSFRTSDHPTKPDAWDIRGHLIATHAGPPTQVATVAIRFDGSMVAVYGGPRKIHYKIRSVEGIWSDQEHTVDSEDDLILSDPQVVLGADDEVHLAYYGNNGSAWYRKLLPDGSMTPSLLLCTDLQPDPDAEDGSILPLVFIPETNTVVVIYQRKSGYLWERRMTDKGPPSPPVQVSDRKVVHSAVDSDQAGADAVAYGTTVHVLFIEDGTGSIYHTYKDAIGDWEPSELLIDGVYGSWVRGSVFTGKESSPVYGFVYDAGSEGGGGMNKYTELPLQSMR